MGIRLHLSGSRVSDRMRKDREARKLARDHKAFHLGRAQAMREEANRLSGILARDYEQMPPEAVTDFESAIEHLKISAIEEENLKCLEDHG